ncbi:YdbL family protein [Sphingomonas bacterium]|uniref:YdbL family protein n=1 Tax=Sphingomonas bacterium TaxID=1895847 RepID=UPI0015753212|nr:YdbL family protein [Sphingomonas bacterium]
MTSRSPFRFALAPLALVAAVPVLAQGAGIEAALESGVVGEQSDGYLGFVRAPSPELRAEVEAINIKRREGYTQVAQARNVPIEAFAASIGCKTLSNLRAGRAYSVARGVWSTRTGAPVTLPSQCGG